MQQNPKLFFAIVNNQKIRKKEIGPFKIGNEYIYEGKTISNSFKDEIISKFSEKSLERIKTNSKGVAHMIQ